MFFACEVLSLEGEICWKMGSSRVDISDGAGVTQQDLMKQPGNIGPGFFSQVVLEKHVIGTRYSHYSHYSCYSAPSRMNS